MDPLTDYISCFPPGKRLKKHHDRYIMLSDILGYYMYRYVLSRRRASEKLASVFRVDYRDVEDYSMNVKIVVFEDVVWKWYGKKIEIHITTFESPESKTSSQRIRTSTRFIFTVPISCTCQCLTDFLEDAKFIISLVDSSDTHLKNFSPYYEWVVEEEGFEFEGCSEIMSTPSWCNGVQRSPIRPLFEVVVEVTRASGKRAIYREFIEDRKLYADVLERCYKCIEQELLR